MRVIAGRLGGRTFNSPHGHRTHPMSEKIRGAIFNSLGDVSGLRVLDAYAGTGALAIEAISRGAAQAVAIDLDAAAHRIIQENIEALKLASSMNVVRAAVRSWSRRHQKENFDIVFLDPPYDEVVQKDLELIATIHTKIQGIVVLSLPSNVQFTLHESTFKQLSAKNYGDATVFMYRRIS